MNGIDYCQYTKGVCDQELPKNTIHRAFFVYPSQPTALALTINKAVREMQEHSSKDLWKTWESLRVSGQIIFCEICSAMRASNFIVGDITTLNFNVLFELGYAIGLNKPVLPVRDTTFCQDQRLFTQLGMFDVLGFKNFQNSKELRSLVTKEPPSSPVFGKPREINRSQPIYYIKSHVETDGSLKLTSCLNKCAFRFRTFDSRETARLSLREAFRQIVSSASVVAHLVDANRMNADIHNARCAFLCGMAMAAGKHVLMLQEGILVQPIDYRDIVIPYTDPLSIPQYVETFVRDTADTLLFLSTDETVGPKTLLENIDLGDVAAENEIQSLSLYFVKTPQYQQATQGHARLVVGRKGSGKTAIFYTVIKAASHHGNFLILDLKPEGHQFKKLKEVVLNHMSEGVQELLLTTFWTYLLLLETVKKLLELKHRNAYSDPKSLQEYTECMTLYKKHKGDSDGDFSERLMFLVNRVIELSSTDDLKGATATNSINVIYGSDIKELNKIALPYLECYDGMWLLFDNIDKGWATRGASTLDVSILRCLIEATRKLQRSFGSHNIDFKSIVFIRKDIHDLLVDSTPDRGKESSVNLDWSDVELIKELLAKRFTQSVDLHGSFDEIWTKLVDPHVAGEDSFRYICSRTLLRPRDVLNFVRKCILIAASRNHIRVEQEDITSAEREFSEDMLNALSYEIRDVFPEYPKVLNAFIGQNHRLSTEDLEIIIMDTGVPEQEIENVKDTLLWFSFLGITHEEDARYSYQIGYNLAKLKNYIQSTNPQALVYVIHPAFRVALEVT